MLREQLYYPNITPRMTAKLAISFLHWDRVVRIFPKEGTAEFRPSRGVIKDLEEEGILVNETLDFNDIEKATTWFERLIAIVEGPTSAQQSAAKSLVRPIPKLWEISDYYIYKGKANRSFRDDYPKYFHPGTGSNGNEIFFCTKETGLTYITLLAYFLNERKQYANTITDQPDAFPLFIVLNRLLHFSSQRDSNDFVPVVEAAKQVERIFFIPLLRVLEPANFEGEKTIEKIISFRRDPNNEELRKGYLGRIDSFLSDLKQCHSDTEANEVAERHEQDIKNHLKILIAACEAHDIPVNRKIVSHGRMNGWEVAGRLWDATCKVIDIATKNVLAIVKPLLKLKPSLDFYNKTLKKTDDFYPLLIQETFAPTFAQRLFGRIRQLDEIKISS